MEHLSEQIRDRRVEILFVQEMLIDRVDEPLRIIVVGEETYSGLDCFRESLREREFLYAESIVAEDAGVRVDVPLESHPLAKQLAEKRGIIGPGDFFQLLLVGLPPFRWKLPTALRVRWIVVVGHDRAGSRVHRSLEWRKLVFEKAARSGVDGPLPPGVVRVQPFVHGAIAGKVLHRHSDGCRAESPALEANHDLPGDVGIEFGILAECGLDAIPSRLGGDVYLVPVHLLNSRGAPLDARDFGEVPDELEVVRRPPSPRSPPAPASSYTRVSLTWLRGLDVNTNGIPNRDFSASSWEVLARAASSRALRLSRRIR